MIIRKAEPKDAQAIAQINVDTWKDTYRGLIDDAVLNERKVDEKRIMGWLNRIQDPSYTVLVYEDKDILGYLWAGPARDAYQIKNEVYALYVQPDNQKKGIGSKLLEKYKQQIKGDGFYLYALKNNIKASCFYEKNGGVIWHEATRKIEDKNTQIEEICYVFKRDEA